MGKHYIFTGQDELTVITEGEGIPRKITGPVAKEVEKRLEEKKRLGAELTKKLKENGFVVAGEEDTVPG